jgi:hypothetical protein
MPREFEVIGGSGRTNYRTIETIVISERRENTEFQAATVHACHIVDVSGRPCNPKLVWHRVCASFVMDALCRLSAWVLRGQWSVMLRCAR